MAIKTVRVQINGTWHNLSYNSSTGKYEKTITAPNITSYNVNDGHYYPVTVEAENTAGTKITVDDMSPTIGDSLRLRVKERIKPTINITSPGSGAFVINSKQPIVFQLRDEANGSGVDISTLTLQIDTGTIVKHNSSGMVCNKVTNGYDCVYTPTTALEDGSHTVKINVKDFDGNSATEATRTYKVDTIPPTLNITAPSDNFITNKASMVVQGNTNDNLSTTVTIEIKLNGVDQGNIPVTNGNFSKSLTLSEGLNTIVVTATDDAGKVSTVTIKGTLDTSVPKVNKVTLTPNPADTGETVVISVEVTG